MRPQVPAHPEDDRLLELAYGELPASEARALRQHVDGCARCRGVLDGIAQVRTAFRSAPTEPAPERGLESLLAYGEQAAARARSRRGGLRILGLLSAAALAVAWLVLPAPQKQPESVARVTAPSARDTLAQAELPPAPVQGDRARDEEKGAAGPAATKPAAPAAAPLLAKKERAVVEEQAAPGRRAPETRVEAEAKRKDVAKLDAPAERNSVAEALAQLRADATPMDRSESRANASGLTGPMGSSAVAGAGALAGAGVPASPKGPATGHLGSAGLDQSARQAPAVAAARAPQDAARLAAAPAADAIASAERTRSEASSEASQPGKPLSKASPAASGGKGATPVTPSPPAGLRSIPMQSARVGMGTPQQEARHAEILRKLETARGDERKALLMEQCELEASLQRGPDAVLSCSKVAREFPGTPEAKRAAEIARGFSLQLPSDAPER